MYVWLDHKTYDVFYLFLHTYHFSKYILNTSFYRCFTWIRRKIDVHVWCKNISWICKVGIKIIWFYCHAAVSYDLCPLTPQLQLSTNDDRNSTFIKWPNLYFVLTECTHVQRVTVSCKIIPLLLSKWHLIASHSIQGYALCTYHLNYRWVMMNFKT